MENDKDRESETKAPSDGESLEKSPVNWDRSDVIVLEDDGEMD